MSTEDLSPEERAVEERDIAGVRRTIAVGMDVAAFLTTASGQALVLRCEADALEAMRELVQVNAADLKAVVEAQIEARVPAAVLAYLGRLIAEGQSAEEQFIQAEAAAAGS